jgi:hypothetical protein
VRAKGTRKRKAEGSDSGLMSARALLERIGQEEEKDEPRLTAREQAYVERAKAAQEMQERAFDRPTLTQAQMMLASLRGAGPLMVKRFREGGDVIEEDELAAFNRMLKKQDDDARTDRYFQELNEAMAETIRDFRFGRAQAEDVQRFFPGHSEWDIHRRFGDTDEETNLTFPSGPPSFKRLEEFEPAPHQEIDDFGPEGRYRREKVLGARRGGEVSTEDFISKREKGSPPDGEVPTDDYIQQMMVGTIPQDRQRNPGILPPEIRGAVDVPLDFLNLLIRGGAGAVAGPAYGVYKGVTGGKYGTPEGVKEASSEAGEMMARITGEPKTQTARDTLEFIGKKAEELKLAPTPQLLTLPVPGPGAASALLRNYELAQTAPAGTVKLPGAKAQVTPPKNEMGFFSPTEQVVMNLPQEKGTAQQMLAQISKAPGAKAAELRATGLEEFLKSKGTAPVTRQEIQNYLANNRVQVNEVVLGKGQTLSPEAKRLSDEALSRMEEADNRMAPFFEQMSASGSPVGGRYSTYYRIRGPLSRKIAGGDQEALAELDALNLPPDVRQAALDFGNAKAEYIKYTGQARRMEKPKFDKYNTPGGTNAREIYLTLPGKTVAPTPYTKSPATMLFERDMLEKYKADNFPSIYNRLSPNEVDRYEMLVREDRNAAKTESMLRDKQTNFTVPSAHSVSPEADKNRLAHIFLDDRTDAEGKKVLFVQELQSDWAQQGRDKGFEIKSTPWDDPEYKAARARSTELLNEFNENNANPVRQNEIRPLLDEARRLEQSFEGKRGLPPAPFVQNTEDWVNLALKRVINEAVDNGYDKVAFISGQQAAKKYSLSTVLDAIEVSPLPTTYISSTKQVSPGSRVVELKRKDGGIIETYVNKEGEIEAVADVPFRQLTGKPLSEVVGKEMAEKVMATELKDKDSTLFTVKDMEVGGEGMKGFYDNILPKTANKLLSKLGSKIEEVGIDNQPYLGFNITPEMIDMVKTQGLPQFAAGGEVTKFIKMALA